MHRKRPQELNPVDATIARLRDELYQARRTILDLMPDDIREILTSYYHCETSKDTYTWDDEVAAALIDLAKPLPNAAPEYIPNRAYCPLCQRGSSSPYAEGFALTEGLRRHLIGWGDVQRCDVMDAAIALARESWRSRFEAADAAEDAKERERKEQRKSTETLYRLGPKEDPLLIDDSVRFGRAARDLTQLMWAEQRLSALGFQVVSEARIKSYIQSGNGFVVYADPRTEGEISFRVYWIPQPKKFGRRYAHFSLKDAWKHDLVTKYKTRLVAALSQR